MDDYLTEFEERINLPEINKLREERAAWLEKKGALPFREAVEGLSPFQSCLVDLSKDAVVVGEEGELTPAEHEILLASMKKLLPWRKGPFRLFGHEIDAEWQSNLKWDRIVPHLDPLKGKNVADVGCNNGYYMFRMAHQKPKLVIGFDPMARFLHQFNFVNRFARQETLKFELLGAEHLHFFRELFDVVLCLGVLYHNRNPIDVLSGLFDSLKPGGQLILEAQAIPGEGSHALFPEGRYAKARNVWFVPTAECLVNWAKRTGFREVECFSVETTTGEEQRTTNLAPWESLKDFLDPTDTSKTVEGYPAPMRVCVKARKPKIADKVMPSHQSGF